MGVIKGRAFIDRSDYHYSDRYDPYGNTRARVKLSIEVDPHSMSTEHLRELERHMMKGGRMLPFVMSTDPDGGLNAPKPGDGYSQELYGPGRPGGEPYRYKPSPAFDEHVAKVNAAIDLLTAHGYEVKKINHQKKEEPMSTINTKPAVSVPNSPLTRAKNDANEAIYRTLADEAVKLAQGAITRTLKKQGADEKTIGFISNLLSHDLGYAMIGNLAGHSFAMMPMVQNDLRLMKLAEEMRIQGQQKAMSSLLHVFMNEFDFSSLIAKLPAE